MKYSSQTAAPAAGVIHRKCDCGKSAAAGATCTKCGKRQHGDAGASLKIGNPADLHEQEADRVADQVTASRSASAVAGPRIRPLAAQSAAAGSMPGSVERTLARPGKSLEPAVRQDMETRFGHDFGNVRVHADASAGQSARDVAAHAYTVGRNIVFGAGQYAPQTSHGRRLLAHELTHVVQSASGSGMLMRQPAHKAEAKKAPAVDLCTAPDPQLPAFNATEEKSREKILDEMLRAVRDDEKQAWCKRLRRALAAFSTGQMKTLNAAGVRFWRQGEFPPPFAGDYAPSKAARNEMARYVPQVRVIQWGDKAGVDEIRHELAHAWDHVRGGTVARLDNVKGKKLKQAIHDAPVIFSSEATDKGKDKNKADLTVKDAFDRFMSRPVVDGWAFSNPKTDPDHVTTDVKEFYAEGYSVFHSDNEDAQAFMLCSAPELYLLLEKEALAQKLAVPDRKVLDKNNATYKRKCT